MSLFIGSFFMRLYTFTNVYLNSISQGIQPAHVVHELMVKYTEHQHQRVGEGKMLFDWAKNHKTIISLNGGNNSGIRNTLDTLDRIGPHLNFPFAHFYEDDQSLGTMMTSVGIIVPKYLYDRAATIRANPDYVDIFSNEYERELLTLLNRPLAR